MSGGQQVQCQLWMGGLESYMTESFILSAFVNMGEKPMSVKIMRNKVFGEPAGYCFVHFENDNDAIDAMHKLNGKVIPNTNPPVRFKLNTASNQGKMASEKEFSLWIGDMSPEIDDYTLFKTFAAMYHSIKAAKVILDASGFSKGFGFLRFGSEDEQRHCLANMNGYKGLGSKPIRICNAIPKYNKPNQPNAAQGTGYQGPGQEYSQYYDPSTYWQNYAGWGNYYDPSNTQNYGQYNYMMQNQAGGTSGNSQAPSQSQSDPDLELVEHCKGPNIEDENNEKAESICSFWDALQNSKWTSPEVFESDFVKIKYTVVDS